MRKPCQNIAKTKNADVTVQEWLRESRLHPSAKNTDRSCAKKWIGQSKRFEEEYREHSCYQVAHHDSWSKYLYDARKQVSDFIGAYT